MIDSDCAMREKCVSLIVKLCAEKAMLQGLARKTRSDVAADSRRVADIEAMIAALNEILR